MTTQLRGQQGGECNETEEADNNNSRDNDNNDDDNRISQLV